MQSVHGLIRGVYLVLVGAKLDPIGVELVLVGTALLLVGTILVLVGTNVLRVQRQRIPKEAWNERVEAFRRQSERDPGPHDSKEGVGVRRSEESEQAVCSHGSCCGRAATTTGDPY